MRNRIGFFMIFMLLCGASLHSQTRISAPNTLFGLGELQYERNSSLLTMGGAAIGYRDPSSINFSNPASYSAINPNSFVFEANIAGNYRKQSNDIFSQNHTYGSPGNMQFAFPVVKKLGASFGFKSYSKVGYKIIQEGSDDYFGGYTDTYEGNGGIDLFYFGLGYKLNKNISIGANSSYTLGKIDRSSSRTFNQDSILLYGFKHSEVYYPRGFILDFGVQYEKEFSKDLKGVIGFIFTPSAKINTEEYNTNQTFTNQFSMKDTMLGISQDKEMILPQKIGAGISLINDENWAVSTSYSMQNWEDFEIGGEEDEHLTQQSNFAIGANFIPDKYAMKHLYKKLNYSMAFRYTENYTKLKDNLFNEVGISFGVGLPLYKRRAGNSMLSLGLEKGVRGNIEDNGYKENFTNFVFSIKINEIWFVKSKYD